MVEDINLRLFDRFRLVGRQMRMGRVPDELSGPDSASDDHPGSPEDTGGSCVRLFKREIILSVLVFNRNGMKQREIAEEMGVSPSTISEMVNRLVEDGYVERTEDPNDRRVKLLVLTKKGRLQAEQIVAERLSILEYIFRHIDETEKQQLIVLLDKLLGREQLMPNGR